MNCVCNFSEQPQVKPDFVQVSSVTTEVVACDEIATLLKCYHWRWGVAGMAFAGYSLVWCLSTGRLSLHVYHTQMEN